MTATEKEFEIQGVHHLALVCKDMAKTHIYPGLLRIEDKAVTL